MKKHIGFGACGNSQVIKLIEEGVINRGDARLVNSTQDDIPLGYDDITILIGNAGAGRESKFAAEMMRKYLINGGDNDFDSLAQSPGVDTIRIYTSSSGGTGNGAAPVVAKYLTDAYDDPDNPLNIEIIITTGFETDIRELENTIDIFKRISPKYIIQCISNKKALQIEPARNITKAEAILNNELSKRTNIELGRTIVPGKKNIDTTDLAKVNTTPGYKIVDTISLSKIKSVEDFNKRIVEMANSSLSLDIQNPSAKRLAVILSVSEKIEDFVDYNFTKIRELYGSPYEFFVHVQKDVYDEETISIIASGMKMPKDEIQEVLNNLKKASSEFDTEEDDFFDTIEDNKNSFGLNSAKGLNAARVPNKAAALDGLESDNNVVITRVKKKDVLNNF